MGILTADLMQSSGGALITDDFGQNCSHTQEHKPVESVAVCVNEPPQQSTQSPWSAFPPNVRRAFELLDNFDAKADVIIACAESITGISTLSHGRKSAKDAANGQN